MNLQTIAKLAVLALKLKVSKDIPNVCFGLLLDQLASDDNMDSKTPGVIAQFHTQSKRFDLNQSYHDIAVLWTCPGLSTDQSLAQRIAVPCPSQLLEKTTLSTFVKVSEVVLGSTKPDIDFHSLWMLGIN